MPPAETPLAHDAHPSPLSRWFLGPKAENAALWGELFRYVFDDYTHWRRNYFPRDPVVLTRVRRRSQEAWTDHLAGLLDGILNDLKAHFPFYSPRYVGHMLSEQSLPAVMGYFAGLLYNPNNVSDEAAPVTMHLEVEVGRMIAAMLGFDPARAWAHLCSGGTLANLEALWVARTTQFAPLTLRGHCAAHAAGFTVQTPQGARVPLVDLDDATLLALDPDEAVSMPRRLARYLIEEQGRVPDRTLAALNASVEASPYNLVRRGYAGVVARLGLRPALFAPASAHYSLKKVADLLGYGHDAVQLVPVDERFRLDVDALGAALDALPTDAYVAAVVAVAGSTEEGAVDPLHRIAALREARARSANRAFWLHVDAAWGGYVRSLFSNGTSPALAAPAAFPPGHDDASLLALRWDDPDVLAAFSALGAADSATVDPHKMGYVPYPVGVVAFRNGLVREHVTQRAPYIGDDAPGVRSLDQPGPVTAIGPYVIEGSKPGATAAACYLAHRAIPLDRSGHGEIVAATLLSARKLAAYLATHRHHFDAVEAACSGGRPDARCFTFKPLYEPDTNVVCFVAVPMTRQHGALHSVDMDVRTLNRLNEGIYESLSIPSNQRGIATPYDHPFFVSRTRFEHAQYNAASIAPVLEGRLGVSLDAYAQHGLFVLRSTVMNPFYGLAEEEGMDYLYRFVEHLHRTTRHVLDVMGE